MRQKIENMNHYFEEKIAECNAQKKALLSDDRRDEANFWQIKANIYDIFKTILSVAERTKKNDEEIQAFMEAKFAEMTKIWAESGQKADAHGDGQKAVIEQIKVDTAGEIRTVFEQTWGNSGKE